MMKNILIVGAIVAAVAAITALKMSTRQDDGSSCCPCSMAKESVTNHTETGSADVE